MGGVGSGLERGAEKGFCEEVMMKVNDAELTGGGSGGGAAQAEKRSRAKVLGML